MQCAMQFEMQLTTLWPVQFSMLFTKLSAILLDVLRVILRETQRRTE